MTSNLRIGLLATAFIGLGVAAITGWTRKPLPEPVYAAPSYATNPAYPNAGAVPETQRANFTQSDPCVQPGQTNNEVPAYASKAPVRTVHYANREPEPAPAETQSAAPAQSRAPAHHGRSTGKSVAIVAGSAGVGSAIGALAGGGKGAAIGALAGGAGGFAYDRMTHNR